MPTSVMKKSQRRPFFALKRKLTPTINKQAPNCNGFAKRATIMKAVYIALCVSALQYTIDRFLLGDGLLQQGYECIRKLQVGNEDSAIPAVIDKPNDAVDDMLHVAILSNRLTATAVAIGSVCRTSKRSVRFVVISTDDTEFLDYFDKLEDCKATGSELVLQSIDEATNSLLELGFEPIWWQVEQKMVSIDYDPKEWSVQTPYTNDKHAHALNLLRFYLPYLPSLANAKKFLFLDDDVVLQRDIQEIIDLEMPEDKALLAGCQHWVWNGSVIGNFETSWDMSVKRTKYIGNHDVVCGSGQDEQYGCLKASLEQELTLVSQLLDGNSPFATHPLDRQAFNMGLNVFHNEHWKTLKVSHRFEQWVDASNRLRLFPLDSLAFGLGLAYFALGDTVQCYEPGPISHLVGMAFVEERAYEAAGWPLERIHKEAYALHYNGPDKPWETISNNSTCSTGTPSSMLDMWKKACEDVRICPCEGTALA